jgi:hypothetical protein
MSKTTVLRHQWIADGPSTFGAWIGHPNAASVLFGYARFGDRIRRVARTLGSASQGADVRRFRDLLPKTVVDVVIALRRNGIQPSAFKIGAGTVMSNSMMVTASSADVQVVAAASRMLVDVQTWHFDTAGQSRRDHACAGLSVSEPRRLYVLLGKAIAVAAEAEPRQSRMPIIDVPAAAITENGFVVSVTKRAEPAGRR